EAGGRRERRARADHLPAHQKETLLGCRPGCRCRRRRRRRGRARRRPHLQAGRGLRRRQSPMRVLLLLMMCATARADNASDALQLLESGISQFQAGKLEAARDAFLKARDLVPDKANPHRWLGLVYARMGKCSQAVWELESFIRRVPPNDPRTVEAATLR